MKRLQALIVVASALLALADAAPSAQQPQRQLTPEQQAQQEATRQDHQRMLEALKITSLRPGANPNNPQAPNAVNYDESKANPYPKLPDPLVLKNGKSPRPGCGCGSAARKSSKISTAMFMAARRKTRPR
jgi:hypothetical protein